MFDFIRRSRGSASPMFGAWIVHDTRVIASVNVASSATDRRVGMRAFPDATTPLVIERCRWVHSFGMKFPVDVVYLDVFDRIVDIHLLKPNRLAKPRFTAVRVIETAPGAFRHWGLGRGDTLTVRGAEMVTERDRTPHT